MISHTYPIYDHFYNYIYPIYRVYIYIYTYHYYHSHIYPDHLIVHTILRDPFIPGAGGHVGTKLAAAVLKELSDGMGHTLW